MDSDRLLKLKNGNDFTVYLDGQLLLQLVNDKVSAFQTYGKASERYINTLLPKNYSVQGGLLIEYNEGNVVSVKSPMEVLKTWRRSSLYTNKL